MSDFEKSQIFLFLKAELDWIQEFAAKKDKEEKLEKIKVTFPVI